MYKWNKNYIEDLINYLKKLEKTDLIKEDITILKELKSILPNYFIQNRDIKDNINIENEVYKILRHYNFIINKIIKKYEKEQFYNIDYKKIITREKELLIFTRDNIKNINKKWAEKLDPWFLNKKIISFKRNNENYIIPLRNLNEYFISLSKNNDITDFINPTHEFLHIYWNMLNYNTLHSIEGEFLSILGEFITTYEMKNNNMYKDEVIKYDIDNINRLLEFIIDLPLRKKIAKNNVKNNTTIYSTYKYHNIHKRYIKDIYCTSIAYDYKTVISYFIAIELFEIYKIDKEKCIFIAEEIIKSNDKLIEKLKTHNINIQKNSDNFIKQLKKEYDSINNQ